MSTSPRATISTRLPEPLRTQLGGLQFVLEVELTPERKLAREDAAVVRENLAAARLPPAVPAGDRRRSDDRGLGHRWLRPRPRVATPAVAAAAGRRCCWRRWPASAAWSRRSAAAWRSPRSRWRRVVAHAAPARPATGGAMRWRCACCGSAAWRWSRCWWPGRWRRCATAAAWRAALGLSVGRRRVPARAVADLAVVACAGTRRRRPGARIGARWARSRSAAWRGLGVGGAGGGACWRVVLLLAWPQLLAPAARWLGRRARCAGAVAAGASGCCSGSPAPAPLPVADASLRATTDADADAEPRRSTTADDLEAGAVRRRAQRPHRPRAGSCSMPAPIAHALPPTGERDQRTLPCWPRCCPTCACCAS